MVRKESQDERPSPLTIEVEKHVRESFARQKLIYTAQWGDRPSVTSFQFVKAGLAAVAAISSCHQNSDLKKADVSFPAIQLDYEGAFSSHH